MDENRDKKEHGVKFLLQEFGQIDTERLRLRGEAVQRLNFFLTLTSAILGGLVLFGQSSSLIRIDYIVFAALLFLSTIGWQTFDYIIGRDINTDRLLRAGGRIRRYFVKNDPTIQKYLMWQNHDEPSGYITHNTSAIRRTVEAILSFLLAVAVGLLVNFIVQQEVIPFIGGAISFMVFLAGLKIYAFRRFQKAVKEAQEKEILHPKETIEKIENPQVMNDKTTQ